MTENIFNDVTLVNTDQYYEYNNSGIELKITIYAYRQHIERMFAYLENVLDSIIAYSPVIEDYSDPVFTTDGGNPIRYDSPDAVYNDTYMSMKTIVNLSDDCIDLGKLITMCKRLSTMKIYPEQKYSNTISFHKTGNDNLYIFHNEWILDEYDKKYSGINRCMGTIRDQLMFVNTVWPGHEDIVYEYYDVKPVIHSSTVHYDKNDVTMTYYGYSKIKRFNDSLFDGLDVRGLTIFSASSNMSMVNEDFYIPSCEPVFDLYSFKKQKFIEIYGNMKRWCLEKKVMLFRSERINEETIYGLMILIPEDMNFYVIYTPDKKDFEELKRRML